MDGYPIGGGTLHYLRKSSSVYSRGLIYAMEDGG